MSWKYWKGLFPKKRTLRIGQVRQLTQTIDHIGEIGDKVIVKGPGEYGGWDVEIALQTGKCTDILASVLVDKTDPI